MSWKKNNEILNICNTNEVWCSSTIFYTALEWTMFKEESIGLVFWQKFAVNVITISIEKWQPRVAFKVKDAHDYKNS